MTDVYGAREARKNFRKILDEAVQHGKCTVIKRNGEPVAVLIPWDHYVMLYLEIDDDKSKTMADKGLCQDTEIVA